MKNKGADQLPGYRKADMRLFFRICIKPVFSRRGSCTASKQDTVILFGRFTTLLGRHSQYTMAFISPILCIFSQYLFKFFLNIKEEVAYQKTNKITGIRTISMAFIPGVAIFHCLHELACFKFILENVLV